MSCAAAGGLGEPKLSDDQRQQSSSGQLDEHGRSKFSSETFDKCYMSPVIMTTLGGAVTFTAGRNTVRAGNAGGFGTGCLALLPQRRHYGL
jgi:hypothetical protein